MTKIQYLLVDLDDTIYTDTTGLFIEVKERIETWLSRALEISPEQAKTLRGAYYRAYGTTMSGLQHHHPEADIDAYLEDVHRVDVSRYLQPNPALAEMLGRFPVEKVVFTNATTDWAERILRQLGVRDCFSQIVDVRAVDYVSKPFPEAYRRLLVRLNVPGEACVLVDDQVRNLKAGAEFGMRTILVRAGVLPEDGVEFAVSDILEIEPILEELLLL